MTCYKFQQHVTGIFIIELNCPKNIFKSSVLPIGQLIDYIMLAEFQQRRSRHLHCLFWVKDVSVYGIDTDKEVTELIDRNITTSSVLDGGDTQFVMLQVNRHSKSCKRLKGICRFGFPLPPMKETKLLEPLIPKHMKKL